MQDRDPNQPDFWVQELKGKVGHEIWDIQFLMGTPIENRGAEQGLVRGGGGGGEGGGGQEPERSLKIRK